MSDKELRMYKASENCKVKDDDYYVLYIKRSVNKCNSKAEVGVVS